MEVQCQQESAKRGNELTEFTLNLYKEVLDGDKNVFISPFSVSAAVLLANLGAGGTTEEEIRRALGLGHLSSKQAHQLYKSMQNALNAQPKGSTTLETANRIFARLGLKVSSEYKDDSLKYYESGIELMDFINDGEGSRKKINAWVEEKTRDKIKDLLPSGIIDHTTLMVLVNAIYFKGKWLEPFEERMTRDYPFYLTRNNTKQVKMMGDTQKVAFIEDRDLNCTAVELLYEDRKVSMVLIRPDEIDGLSQLEKTLTAQKFESLLARLSQGGKQKVILGVPRFKMEATYELKKVLAALGIVTMFDPSSADFSRMLPDDKAFVSAVIHKTFVEVNEEGTEAAAASAMIMALGCARNAKPPPKFILDRPFAFLIREQASGAVLFMGRYSQPE